MSHPNFEAIRHEVTFPLYVEVDRICNPACSASPVHYQTCIALPGEPGIVPLPLFLAAIVLLLRAQWAAPKSVARDATVAWVLVITLYCISSRNLLEIEAFMFLAGLSAATGAAAQGGGRSAKA